uniref:Uncharacterized protein n=1 Tax=Nelumbo nucifera TaxID=4432 RepID=A0A822ZBB1_NELNU|nr:TPA_asm: hypothetical protein HUJ06_001774 [Nelumbo nucifera]
MPHRTRPMASLLVFMGVNVILVSTITPVENAVARNVKALNQRKEYACQASTEHYSGIPTF